MQRSREIALSLAGAREYIERYMENKKSTLKENEKAGFYQLITFINTIEAQSGWKENDSLSNYWKEVEKSKLDKEIKLPPLNQVQIRKDALSRELKTYEFSNRQVQTLYNQINNEMPIFNNHSILKQQVNAALSAVMTGLNPDWKSVNNNQSKNIPLPKSTIRRIDLYQTQFKEHYDLCTTLQGSYIPFNQAADPLIGKAHDANTVEGYCRGHTRIWANKIADHGRFDSLQRVTSATTRLQRDQEITVEHGRSYTQLIDIPECIQDVFGTNIRENVTYGIDLAHAGDINKHIIGFRKIPLTGQIEIFDANIGLFIFPDMDAFKIWFSHVFSTIYASPYGGGISLEILGPQKENAKASIPPTIESSSIEFKYSDTLKLDTSRSAINFERITLKLNTFAHIALRDKKIEIKEELLSHQMIQFAEAMRRIFLHKLGKTDKKEELIYPDVTSKSKYLKETACSAIDNEIKRLDSNSFFNTNTQNSKIKTTIAALKKLKNDIEEAKPYITLNAIVSRWQDAKPPQGTETYREIIDKNKSISDPISATTAFVLNLARTHEVNPLSLYVLQNNLLYKILSHVLHWGKPGLFNKKLPETVQSIKQQMLAHANDSETLLKNIIREANKKSTNIVTNTLVWRGKKTSDFYDILKKIDLNNPESIVSACNNLDTLPHQSAVKEEKSASAPKPQSPSNS